MWRSKIDFGKFAKIRGLGVQRALSELGSNTPLDFDNKSFYAAVSEHQKEERGRLELRSLTVEQLEKVVGLNKANTKDDELVTLLFRKTFETSGVLEGMEREQFSLKEQRQRLKDMLTFLKRFPEEKFESLRTNVVYELLGNGLALGELEKEFFLAYLKKPLGELNALNIQSKKYAYETSQQEERECLTRIKAKWRHDAYSATAKKEDSRIVKRYLEYFLVEKKEPLSTFLPFFHKNELQRIEKEAQFMAGQEVKMEEHEYSRFEELARTVEIEFLPTNQSEFRATEAVHLDLRLKNVAQLLVRVFEINTENYYRQHLAAFRSDLNLEGLLPA